MHTHTNASHIPTVTGVIKQQVTQDIKPNITLAGSALITKAKRSQKVQAYNQVSRTIHTSF